MKKKNSYNNIHTIIKNRKIKKKIKKNIMKNNIKRKRKKKKLTLM
jgi:hypothetical protein